MFNIKKMGWMVDKSVSLLLAGARVELGCWDKADKNRIRNRKQRRQRSLRREGPVDYRD